ncbi:MAG: Ig-like domain-containing protein, partial [bacterium]|nr:Ig-like domain-containing protein [bacterium]
LEPAADAHIRGTQTIKVEAPASTYEVRMMVGTNGTTWYRPTDGTSTPSYAVDATPADGWTCTWDTTRFIDGLWMVKAVAYGTGSTELGSAINGNIEIDNNAGTFSLSLQSILSRIGTISATGVASDIEKIIFEYEKNGTYLIATDVESGFDVSWNTLGMADGTCTVVVRSYDELDNTYATSSVIQIDNTSPVISNISPAANSLLNGTQAISWAVTDMISGVVSGSSQLSIDGGAWVSATTDTSYQWLSSSLKGQHTFQIRAIDNEGNMGYSEQVVVTFDNDAPDAPELSQIPLIVGTTALSVSGSAEANATVTVYVNDASAGVVKAGVNGTFTMNVTLTPGTNTITAKAQDTFGNGPDELSEYEYVMCDIAAPIMGTVIINSGATYATTSVLHVEWNGYIDTQSGIKGYYYSFGTDTGEAKFTQGAEGELYASGQGEVTAYVWAVDNAGNESNIGTDTIIMDTIVPGVNITQIDRAVPGAKIISEVVPVEFAITSALYSIAGMPAISIDGAAFVSVTTWWSALNTGTHTLDTRVLSDGIHTLQVRAIDNAGNVGYSSVRSIEIDNTLSGVVILEPATDAHVSGTKTIRVIAPPAVYEMLIQVSKDGSYWFNPAVDPTTHGTYTDTVSMDGWSASWATTLFTNQTGIGDGTYTVRAIAYGTGGTMLGSTTNTGIEVDNTINVPVVPTITTPTRGVLSGTVSVDGDVTEVTFEYLRNGTYTIGIDTEAPFSYSWNTYSILDGTYTIRVTVKDEVGNEAATVSNAFKVDNTS